MIGEVIGNLFADLLLMIMRIIVVVFILPTYILFLCIEKVWVSRVEIWTYLKEKVA